MFQTIKHVIALRTARNPRKMRGYINVEALEAQGPVLEALGPPQNFRIPVYCTMNVHQINSINTSSEVLLLF